jgi:hypothetical protein
MTMSAAEAFPAPGRFECEESRRDRLPRFQSQVLTAFEHSPRLMLLA